MARFVSIPQYVDALRYDKNYPAIEDFTGCDCDLNEKQIVIPGCSRPVNPGDWVIRESDDNLFVLSDVVFRQRYKQCPKSVPWVDTPESSNVAGYEYDGDTQTLTVGFGTGGRYRYFNVDERLVIELGRAESKGQYFNQQIKGAHSYEKVTT